MDVKAGDQVFVVWHNMSRGKMPRETSTELVERVGRKYGYFLLYHSENKFDLQTGHSVHGDCNARANGLGFDVYATEDEYVLALDERAKLTERSCEVVRFRPPRGEGGQIRFDARLRGCRRGDKVEMLARVTGGFSQITRPCGENTMTKKSDRTHAMLKRLVILRSLRLVTFGCGEQFDRCKFEPIANRDDIKPRGGLWSSPVDADYGWKEWSEEEQFGDLSTRFEFDFCGRVLTIDKLAALESLPWRKRGGIAFLSWLDYEAIEAAGVDAIHLTENGQQETRYSDPSLYGWDCECVLVMNPDAVLSR